MELKKYQQKSIEKLKSYLAETKKLGPRIAFIAATDKPYNSDFFGETPFVCIKIPTGGGKTLVATHAVTEIMDNLLTDKLGKGIIIWFVPSEAIKTQTLRKLNDKNDFHRRTLDDYFDNKGRIYSNEEALRIRKQDVEANTCILVSSLDAFRKDNLRDKYKVYQENGELLTFFDEIADETKLDKDENGTVINSLANVIRQYNPLIVIDEGHRSSTELSIEFLNDLNPSFIIEFTATPRSKSNVLLSVHSSELKEEKMVKIPIILESITQWQSAVSRGALKRKELEEIAKKEKGEYIRPIVLLQAEQEKESGNKITVRTIKEFLVKECKIPEEEIAIKTSSKNELDGVDLFSKKCKIRHIITVNALAEGWDCSFAYILISVANIGAKISVEQIIGRIVRLPNAKEKTQSALNNSYIFASAKNFNEAASQIVSGLENNGFSRADLLNAAESKQKYEFEAERVIREKILVPAFFFEDEPLKFGDLVGDRFELAKQNPEFEFTTHYDSDGRIKIDVTKDDEWVKERQTTLHIVYRDKNFSKSELVQWLDKKIRVVEVDKRDKTKFIEKALGHQFKTHSLSELSINRFVLRDKLDETMNQKIEEYTKNRFYELIKAKNIFLRETEDFPQKIIVPEKETEKFKKNIYAAVGKLNKEELNFVSRLDSETLPNILCWVRNKEKQNFYLQGWKRNKFYPDFIALTKKGTIIVLEWKGEDRTGSEDTKYKQEIAEAWQELGKGRCAFFLVNNSNIEAILSQIKGL